MDGAEEESATKLENALIKKTHKGFVIFHKESCQFVESFKNYGGDLESVFYTDCHEYTEDRGTHFLPEQDKPHIFQSRQEAENMIVSLQLLDKVYEYREQTYEICEIEFVVVNETFYRVIDREWPE